MHESQEIGLDPAELMAYINVFRLRQNGVDFTDDIFKWILMSKSGQILIHVSLKFVFNDPIDNIQALVR